ncbi:hypothetical protein BGW38_009252, partial [Lunasporangiospora selenospora]
GEEQEGEEQEGEEQEGEEQEDKEQADIAMQSPHPGDVSMLSVGETSMMSIDPRSPKGKDVLSFDQLKLPTSHKITAAKINDISAAIKNARSREQRLKADEAAQTALRRLRRETNSLSHALTVRDIEKAQRVRRKQRDPLQSFYLSAAAKKDRRTQDLRTKRAWAILAADERRGGSIPFAK